MTGQDSVKQLRARFSTLGIDAFLVTFQPHVRYMTGFSGTYGFSLITRSNLIFFTDGRYRQQAKQELRGWKIIIGSKGIFEEMKAHRVLRSGTKVGIDGNTVSLSQFRTLKRMFPTVRFLPASETIEPIAAVKSDAEIALLKRAITITDRVYEEILGIIEPGMKELEVASEITYRQRIHGADGDAFEPIVASGLRGALPHGRASEKKIRTNEFVTLDFGCIVGGYHSDLTRTIAFGTPPRELRTAYEVVLEAQERAIDKTREGIACREVDAAARGRIAQAGFGRYFQHSLGHGIGLQIHEQPRLSSQSRGVLKSGNVVTIEPGIYLPGIGGVRIEDDVLVTRTGHTSLTRSPKVYTVL